MNSKNLKIIQSIIQNLLLFCIILFFFVRSSHAQTSLHNCSQYIGLGIIWEITNNKLPLCPHKLIDNKTWSHVYLVICMLSIIHRKVTCQWVVISNIYGFSCIGRYLRICIFFFYRFFLFHFSRHLKLTGHQKSKWGKILSKLV